VCIGPLSAAIAHTLHSALHSASDSHSSQAARPVARWVIAAAALHRRLNCPQSGDWKPAVPCHSARAELSRPGPGRPAEEHATGRRLRVQPRAYMPGPALCVGTFDPNCTPVTHGPHGNRGVFSEHPAIFGARELPTVPAWLPIVTGHVVRAKTASSVESHGHKADSERAQRAVSSQ
jgi:hypothetical protein